MMLYRHIIMAFVLIVTIAALCWAGHKIENRIGPFSFDTPLMKESKLISEFGNGYVQLEKVGTKILGKKYIYYVPEQKVWVEISISHVLDENLEGSVESILVTKKKLCDKQFIPKKPFGLLITSKGIKIDDSIDRVIELYGQPSVSINVEEDKLFSVLGEGLKLQQGRILRYLQKQPIDELNFVEFYFNDGKKLHSLLISESE